MGWLHLPPLIWSWLLKLPGGSSGGSLWLAAELPEKEASFAGGWEMPYFCRFFFCLGLWVLLLIVGWLQLAGLCQLSLCVLVWASPDPNYLLQDWVTFFMPTWSPGTYPVRARTGTPSRGGGEWGLYFSFSKGIKWLRAACTFSCLSMNCHPCSSQAQSIMVCCAS